MTVYDIISATIAIAMALSILKNLTGKADYGLWAVLITDFIRIMFNNNVLGTSKAGFLIAASCLILTLTERKGNTKQ